MKEVYTHCNWGKIAIVFFLFVGGIQNFQAFAQGTSFIDSLIDVSWDNRYLNKTVALGFADSALLFSRQNKYLKGEGICYNIYGLIARELNHYSESEKYFNGALKIRRSINDSIGVGNILNNIGALKRLKGEFNSGLDSLHQATIIFEKLDHSGGLAMCYDNIANILDDQQEYHLALYYNEKSLSLHEIEEDSFAIAISKLNLSERYMNLGKLDTAKQFCHEALNLFLGIDDWEGEAIAYSRLGEILESQDSFLLSEYFFLKSINKFIEYDDYSSGLMHAYWGIADLYISNKNPARALDYLNKASKLTSVDENIENQRFLGFQKAKAFEDLNEFDSAFYYLQDAAILNDSIYSKEKSRQFAEMQTKYKTEKTTRELAEETILKNEATFQKNIFFSLFLFAIISSIFGYNYFQQKQKAAATIARQELKIHQQEVEELLKTQELTAINSMLEGQENERLRIAKDLHDRLGSMLTTVKWSFDGFLETTENKEQKVPLEKASNMLDEAYQEVRKIAHNMVSGVLTKFGLVAALEELGRTISDDGKMNIKIFTSGMENRMDSKLEITIYRIVQELISNILKHAQASETNIQLTRTNSELNIAVEDNGKGFNPEKIKLGMGIKNMEARVQALNGSFFIDSGKGNGTTVMIDLPV
ncbi:MAG: sensor histidine kinase [Bacteroidota bacterium]